MTETITHTYTVCGLRRDQSPIRRWTGACGTLEVITPGMAVDVLNEDVKHDTADDDGRTLLCTGLALSAVHLGDIDVEQDHHEATLDLTRGQVEEERALHADTEPRRWTFCGNDAKTWRTLCYQVTGATWLLAYVAFLDLARAAHYEPLFAKSHPGWHAAEPGFPYADPLCRNQPEMDAVVRDLWP